MRCRNPFVAGAHAFPCGACVPCRINRRRLWTHRIMLESIQHAGSSFVTLTYADENLRTAAGRSGLLGASLQPKDFQDWLKRFRKEIAPLRIRFFGVGEYGDESFRPHYHAALFGFAPCLYGTTRRERNRAVAARCCDNCRVVQRSWGRGDVELGTLEEGRAAYLAGYVLKKMTRSDDPRLEGRLPEFARMSLRPGIGYSAMWEVADLMLRYDLERLPRSLAHGKKQWPLGRYLRGALKAMTGVDSSDVELSELAERLRPLREAAARSEENPSFRRRLVEAFAQECLQVETKSKIFKQARSL